MKLVLEKHIVTKIEKQTRVSDYLSNKFIRLQSRKSVKKALKKGLILHNGEIAASGTYVLLGDCFELLEENKAPAKIFPLKIEVLFEDEYMAIINKPAGYPVSGNYFKTIQNALPFNLTRSSCEDALPSPLPIHRLDAATSGLLIIAKTIASRIALGKMLEEKKIVKIYNAVVQGYLKTKGTLNTSIDGKAAESSIETLEIKASKFNKFLSLMELSPITGRTHQLRIHLSRIGHPIAGDKIYGKEGNTIQHKGLFLAAVSIELLHPINGNKIEVKIEAPKKFKSYMDREYKNANL